MSAGSLVGRLARLQQGLVAIVVVLFSASALGWTAHELGREEAADLRSNAARILTTLERELGEEPNLRLAASSTLEEESGMDVEFEILDASGATLASFVPPELRPPAGPRRSLRLRAPRGAWVVATLSTQPRRDALAAMALSLALAAVPLLLLALALSRSVARRTLHPLSRMTGAADEASSLGVAPKLHDPSDPAEVARLGLAFDRLVSRLDELLQAERHFVEDAAHELRTPLTALSGELELAMADPALGGRTREALARAADPARAMRELVDALLLLRRADRGALEPAALAEPVNLADLAQDVVAEMARRHPERERDLRVAREDEVLVAGNPTLLASAVRNLVENAIQFTSGGEFVAVTAARDGEQSVVTVEDGGGGVPLEDRERIFDPFFRGAAARAAREGFGLGLPILRRVARAHGGDVALAPSKRGGARFELRLPAWGAKR